MNFASARSQRLLSSGRRYPLHFWRSLFSSGHKHQPQELGHLGNLNLQEICRTGTVPKHFNFAKDVFDWHVSNRPNDTALWFTNDTDEDRKWSFAEIRHESIKSAVFLQKQLENHVKQLQRFPFVLTILPRIPEWWFLHMGSIRTGSIFCPGTTMLTADDIQYRLEASAASMIITDEENVEKVERAHQQLLKTSNPGITKHLRKVVVSNDCNSNGDWVNYNKVINTIDDMDLLKFKHTDTKSEDIAQAFFTSGTTGKPKMVAHVHASYGIGHVETARQLQLRHTDVMWNISDPGWAKSSYSNFFAPWIAGSTVFIHQMKRFDAKKVLEVLRTKPVTTLCAPPTLYRSMIPEPHDAFRFKALRVAVGAGEPVNQEVMRAWADKTGTLSLGQMYGQTELTVVGCQTPDEKKPGSLGKPDGMYEIIVTDETGTKLPAGEEGILAIKFKPKPPVGLFKGMRFGNYFCWRYNKTFLAKGFLVITGYLKPGTHGPVWDEEKNSKCFVNGYYLTGDKCYMDDDGHIYFVGRADDIINSAGYRIGPHEVESVLQTHEAVLESAAVPSPDAERGEIVKAFIVLKEAYKTKEHNDLIKEIQNHVKNQTAPYKYPRKIEFVDDLPKTVSGKILRRELKKLEYRTKT